MRATQVIVELIFFPSIVITRLVRVTHFVFSGRGKLGRPDKPGDDEVILKEIVCCHLGGPHARAMTVFCQLSASFFM
jgi:hypothetical protein